MPAPRSLMLMQCVGSPGHLDDGKWWLAETYLTSDGPRTRIIPAPGTTREEAEAELGRREAIVRPPDINKLRQQARDLGYASGVRDTESRARNRPGDGDMGG